MAANKLFFCLQVISPLRLVNMYKKTKEFWSENEAKRAKLTCKQKNNLLAAILE